MRKLLIVCLSLLLLITSTGAFAFESGSYRYAILDEHTAAITTYWDYATNTHVPDHVDGYTVVHIGEAAFWGNEVIRHVIIPDSVTSIGHAAFLGCDNLNYVTIPDSVNIIAYDAFDHCPNLILDVIRGSYAHSYAQENGIEFMFAQENDMLDNPSDDNSAVGSANRNLAELWTYSASYAPYCYAEDGFNPGSNYGRMLSGIQIGEFGDFLLDCIGVESGGTHGDLLTAMSVHDWQSLPLLEEIADNISIADVALRQSQLLAWKDRYGDLTALEEYYYFEVALYYADRVQTYDLLVLCESETEGGESIDYVVLADRCDYYGSNAYIYDLPQGEGLTLYVANCNEWVSLRAEPHSSAERLQRVPLGAALEDVHYYGSDFAYGCYNGDYGYVLAQYLSINP